MQVSIIEPEVASESSLLADLELNVNEDPFASCHYVPGMEQDNLQDSPLEGGLILSSL